MTTTEAVTAIRTAKTVEDAVEILKSFINPPKIKNQPPTLDEVVEFARERAQKDLEDAIYYIQQAEKAYDFYQSNMEVMGARTWKDGSGNPVKNWKLKLVNNWFK